MSDARLNTPGSNNDAMRELRLPSESSESRPVSFEHAVEMMRADVPVSADWRNALLRDVASAPRPSPSATLPELRRPSLLMREFATRPLTALAACAAAMIVGGAGASVVLQRDEVARVVATNPAGSARTDRQTVIRFALVAPGAKTVSVVGDFNQWDPEATPLVADRDGATWLVSMPLSAGRHVYAFVVDGDLVTDPSAPKVVDHDFGVQNSVVLVGDS